MIKPQDILLAARLHVSGPATYETLGDALGISASQAHAAAKRAIEAGLIRPDLSVRGHALFEALRALKYFCPPRRSAPTVGMPTGHAVEPLKSHVTASQPGPVWPDPNGVAFGEAWSPFYKTIAFASAQDPELYGFLALVECLRYGRAREAEFAQAELRRRLEE